LFELEQARLRRACFLFDASIYCITMGTYDLSGEDGVGVSLKDKSISAGVSGSGKRISKRVYTFVHNFIHISPNY